MGSEFYGKMKWICDVNDDIYDPLTPICCVWRLPRVWARKLQDLVALLSGRNFVTKQFEEAIAEQSFARLKSGIHAFSSLRPTSNASP